MSKKRSYHQLKFLLKFLLIFLLLTGCNSVLNSNKEIIANSDISKKSQLQDIQSEKTPIFKAKVVKVIDGDTIDIEYQKKKERVRFILVDTPETKKKGTPVQPFGMESFKFTSKLLLEGSEVEIELDVQERDTYKRLLGYVYINGISVQEELLKNGLARVAVFPPNVKHIDKYREIQKNAQEKAIGIWSIENYVTDTKFDHNVINNQNTKEMNEEVVNKNICTIKGNINSKGEKIYHLPSGQFYNQTIAEQLFCSEEEARKSGFRKSIK